MPCPRTLFSLSRNPKLQLVLVHQVLVGMNVMEGTTEQEGETSISLYLPTHAPNGARQPSPSLPRGRGPWFGRGRLDSRLKLTFRDADPPALRDLTGRAASPKRSTAAAGRLGDEDLRMVLHQIYTPAAARRYGVQVDANASRSSGSSFFSSLCCDRFDAARGYSSPCPEHIGTASRRDPTNPWARTPVPEAEAREGAAWMSQ